MQQSKVKLRQLGNADLEMIVSCDRKCLRRNLKFKPIISLIFFEKCKSYFLFIIFVFLIDNQCFAKLDTIVIDSLGSSLIELDSLSACECRSPSIFPESVEEANRFFPCRQMKIVQHWLNNLIHPKSYRAKPYFLGSTEYDLSNEDHRLQYFFGPYWSTYLNHESLNDGDRKEMFISDLRNAFPRLMAVLIASTYPSERMDGGNWYWELPDIYADLPLQAEEPLSTYEDTLLIRAEQMRNDVNNWLERSGIWVFADAGSDDNSDFDFVLNEIITFMYVFKDRSDLLYDFSAEVLTTKGWVPEHASIFQSPSTDWFASNVPFSGQMFERELWFKQGPAEIPETENHVLMTLTHYYLINQWVSNNYHNSQDFVTTPPGQVFNDWYSVESDAPISRIVRDITARPMHKGYFEDNSRSYQGFSFHALMNLAAFVNDSTIKIEAENALHFLATKIAFQSLDGRRFTPMRRNCEKAYNLYMYEGDAAAVALGIISGAYKWNDSPYGLKLTLQDSNSCFQANQDTCNSCYWNTYTWKKDSSNVDTDFEDDSGGEGIALNASELANDFPFGGTAQAKALYFAFSGYRLPAAVQGYMLNKRKGYYARMMPQYDIKDYQNKLYPPPPKPGYFNGDNPVDSGKNNERTPEFYFAGANDYLNISGGIYNNFRTSYADNKDYLIQSIPGLYYLLGLGKQDDLCTNYDELMPTPLRLITTYDYLSRPYAILPSVQTVTDDEGKFAYYKPFGTKNYFTYDEAKDYMPLMRGNSDYWFKSSNMATYKNFSYGYRTRKTGPGLYAILNGEFPMNLPSSWLNEDIVRRREFKFGKKFWGKRSAIFNLYDLRNLFESQGKEGLYLVTARVRKHKNIFWSSRVARGFWEVVPGHLFNNLEELENEIRSNNEEKWFKLPSTSEHYTYKLVVSKEIVRLSKYYGAIFDDLVVRNEGRVQGIIDVKDPNGNPENLKDVFIRFRNNGFMNSLPLIDVKAVNEDYSFRKDTDNKYEYCACAQDGWLAVNNEENGTWLFADSRRGDEFTINYKGSEYKTPYWISGTFDDSDPWPVACGSGEGGSWTPAPPVNGTPEDCSSPELCPPGSGEVSFADLSVRKTGSSSPPNNTVEFSIYVINNGPSIATSVIVNDTIRLNGFDGEIFDILQSTGLPGVNWNIIQIEDNEAIVSCVIPDVQPELRLDLILRIFVRELPGNNSCDNCITNIVTTFSKDVSDPNHSDNISIFNLNY